MDGKAFVILSPYWVEFWPVSVLLFTWCVSIWLVYACRAYVLRGLNASIKSKRFRGSYTLCRWFVDRMLACRAGLRRVRRWPASPSEAFGWRPFGVIAMPSAWQSHRIRLDCLGFAYRCWPLAWNSLWLYGIRDRHCLASAWLYSANELLSLPVNWAANRIESEISQNMGWHSSEAKKKRLNAAKSDTYTIRWIVESFTVHVQIRVD